MTESGFNFLRQYVSLFEETEVPPRFAVWSGLSAISSILERRVWIDMGAYSVYPNTYVVFVGSSGVKKSTPIVLTQKLLHQVSPGPRMLSQQITASALVDALRSVKAEEGKIEDSCGGMLISDELKTFLNQDNYKALCPFLIPFYDCRDYFSYHTRSHGIESVDYVHLSLLAATTIEGLRDAIPVVALADGLASRIIFVHVTDKEIPPPVAIPKHNPHRAAVEELLLKHLQKLASVSGPITLSEDGRDFFIKEYNHLYYHSPFKDSSFSGYAKRRDKHLLKLAICVMFSLGVPERLELTAEHLDGAKTLLEDVESKMMAILDLIQTTEKGDLVSKIFQLIASSKDGVITRAEVLKRFSHKIDALDLVKVEETLVRSEKIKKSTNELGQLTYEIIKKDDQK